MGWLELLVCGDYVSPVEIPWISETGSVEAYLDTLSRLRGLLDRVQTVVPGHGGPIPAQRALAILDEDVAYLDGLLKSGSETPLPDGRRTGAQAKIHAENVSRLS
jgi:glyoxylase-like metal-dependent hydrolase (beta-lactamase superfamily II)